MLSPPLLRPTGAFVVGPRAAALTGLPQSVAAPPPVANGGGVRRVAVAAAASMVAATARGAAWWRLSSSPRAQRRRRLERSRRVHTWRAAQTRIEPREPTASSQLALGQSGIFLGMEWWRFPKGTQRALNFFEPRYREMMRRALTPEGDKRFAVVFHPPAFEDGALGRLCTIVDYEQLPDGQYNCIVELGAPCRILKVMEEEVAAGKEPMRRGVLESASEAVMEAAKVQAEARSQAGLSPGELVQTAVAIVTARRARGFTTGVLGVGFLAALAGDFLGLTSGLLGLNPGASRDAGLDAFYPVESLRSFKREGKYSLRYPDGWPFDPRVQYLQQVEKAEREGSPDVLTLKSSRRSTSRALPRLIPDAAFRPPGGGPTTDSLAVVVRPVVAGNLDEVLGEPAGALERLAVLAAGTPVGAGAPREGAAAGAAEVLVAGRRSSGADAAYEFEYILPAEGASPRMHVWSVVTLGSARLGGAGASRPLYTMTLVVPESGLTPARRRVMTASWQSFTSVSSTS